MDKNNDSKVSKCIIFSISYKQGTIFTVFKKITISYHIMFASITKLVLVSEKRKTPQKKKSVGSFNIKHTKIE